ncbi:unnamed protein product [Ilex paraguariensis]|uniref:Uncharacterized protein n=1 Tax=Ilex paraguariensis TaxID=185542 RepID=A0ABC8U6F7_9AQUA
MGKSFNFSGWLQPFLAEIQNQILRRASHLCNVTNSLEFEFDVRCDKERANENEWSNFNAVSSSLCRIQAEGPAILKPEGRRI